MKDEDKSIFESVNDALNRAGIHCAVTFAEAIDMLAAERDKYKRLWEIDKPGPIRMRLTCEGCGTLHVDEGEFSTKRHHTHQCASCGMVWRPAIEDTVGVRFLWGQSEDEETV